MYLTLLLCTLTLALAKPVPNQCPQPTAENPTPPAFYYGHPDDCTRYFSCAHGNPNSMQCPPQQTWSDFFQTCVGFNTHFDTCTRDNAQRECQKYPNLLIPHPTVCQRYYNCSLTYKQHPYLDQYEDECPYPELFDVLEKKCKSYKDAQCGPVRNTVGKAPCEYLKNICPVAHCEPCVSRLPSCVGLTNGNHENAGRLWTPYYIVCENERTVAANLLCPIHTLSDSYAFFSPDKKACLPVWEISPEHGGHAPSCDGKSPRQYRANERPDVFYTCPGAKVDYCGVGSVFNESTGQCE